MVIDVCLIFIIISVTYIFIMWCIVLPGKRRKERFDTLVDELIDTEEFLEEMKSATCSVHRNTKLSVIKFSGCKECYKLSRNLHIISHRRMRCSFCNTYSCNFENIACGGKSGDCTKYKFDYNKEGIKTTYLRLIYCKECYYETFGFKLKFKKCGHKVWICNLIVTSRLFNMALIFFEVDSIDEFWREIGYDTTSGIPEAKSETGLLISKVSCFKKDCIMKLLRLVNRIDGMQIKEYTDVRIITVR